MIVIVDYGMGNLRSVLKSFERIGVDAVISAKSSDIRKADKLILPGVGHFGKAMENLIERNLIEPLNHQVLDCGTPILGICLGMQLFSKWSEEGDVNGLGWINAKTIRFDTRKMRKPMKIPHMGWNEIQPKKNCAILSDVKDTDTFYFVHRYIVECENKSDIAAVSEYGYGFVSAIQRDNIFGTQFHPEKSHTRGIRILEKYAELDASKG